MSHFSADEWVDFTRGLLPPAKTALMQASLDGNCSECRSALQLWSAILESLPREREYRPSEAAIEAVKKAYTPQKPWKWMLTVAEFAHVLFDSLQEPTLAGVRSSAKSSRQITVEATPYVIDLQLESDAVRKRVSLTGQVFNSDHSKTAPDGVDIVLLSFGSLIRKTKTNDLGEFYLDFGGEESLRLFINIRGERAIGIALPSLENSEANGGRSNI
ncbi:MAG: hypothetical protein JO185_24815 [Acidobacteriaceae bacterium]|nr:hypothetical protein [Acidobacteriaceae bacterium]